MAKQECTGSFESVKYSPEGKLLSGKHLLQQIINDKGEFSEQECRALLESEGAASWKQVQLRGVIGGTAAGKSTLLNQLEGTEFAVHDGERFVTSKTSGVWIGASPTSKGVIVLDFEGSNAFGLGNSTKDAQLMWLAISLCPVLMWCIAGPSADRVNSSLSQNISLLFQVYLRAPKEWRLGKRAIVFVVKEKDSDTQFREFKKAFLAGIEEVFRLAKASAGQKSGRLEDIMQIEVVGLKHERPFDKKNPSYGYKQDVTRLNDILNRLHNDEDIQSAYTVKPKELFDISSFSKHLAQTWQAVTSYELLQIDDHLELFASNFCRGLLTHTKETFNTALGELRAGTKIYNPADFHTDITRLQEQARDELKHSGLDKYPRQLQALEPELEQHMLQQAREWRTDLVRSLKTKVVRGWHVDFGEMWPPRPWEQGQEAVACDSERTAFQRTKDYALALAKRKLKAVLIDGLEESQEKDINKIECNIKAAYVIKLKENVSRIKTELRQELLGGCDVAFEANAPQFDGPQGSCRIPSAKFWGSLRSAHKSMEMESVQRLHAQLQTWGEEEAARKQAASELRAAAVEHLRRRWKAELADKIPLIIETLCAAEGNKAVNLVTDAHLDKGVLKTRFCRIQCQCTVFQLEMTADQRTLLEEPWLDKAAQESDTKLYWGLLRMPPRWWPWRKQSQPSSPPSQNWAFEEQHQATASCKEKPADQSKVLLKREDIGVDPSKPEAAAAWKLGIEAIDSATQKKQDKSDQAWKDSKFWQRVGCYWRVGWRDVKPGYKRKERISDSRQDVPKKQKQEKSNRAWEAGWQSGMGGWQRALSNWLNTLPGYKAKHRTSHSSQSGN